MVNHTPDTLGGNYNDEQKRICMETDKSNRKGIVGYVEMFMTNAGKQMSVPGASRWIDGPVLDESKAVIID